MKNRLRSLAWSKVCPFVVVAAACSNPPPAVEPKPVASVASTSTPAPPLAEVQTNVIAELPSGSIGPIEHQEVISGIVVSAEQTGDTQTVLVAIPQAALTFEEPFDAVVTLRGEAPLLSVLGAKTSDGKVEVWLRRRVPSDLGGTAATPTRVDVYTAADLRSVPSAVEPGHHYRIAVDLPPPAQLKPNPTLFQRYLSAVSSAAPADSPIRWLLERKNALPLTSRDEASAEWTQWMRLTSGYDSIEAALATAPNLRDVVARAKTNIPLKTLTPPALRRHPWSEMLQALPQASTQEALASLAPADFYFVRSRSFDAFQSLLTRVDELVTPVLGITTKRREVLDLSERYRLELGLPEGELTRVLGPSLISTLAVVGSDPLLRQGSDVSILMAVPSAKAVTTALAVRRAELGARFALKQATWKHEGIDVVAHLSPNGEVRQYVATHIASTGEEYVLVSNSPNATRRIVDVWVGKSTSLGDELDLQYMLRRDALANEDVLAYMSDKFVAQVVSPRQRILEVRRQVAKSELLNVGYAALLYARVFGNRPSDLSSLTKLKWLASGAKHATGETIGYAPSDGPQSSWGRAARLTSIIDLPTPQHVSKTEQQAYQSFVQSYEQHWGENIDPIALRITTTAGGLDAQIRILPVANDNDYSDIARFSGGGSTNRVPSLHALAAILAIGQESELRTLLGQQGESFLGARLALDWLGDWIEVGLADDALLAETALAYGDFPQPPSGDSQRPQSDFDVLAKLPLYVTIDIKSAAGAALLLTKLRELATEAAPDVVRWGELKTEDKHKVVRVSFDEVSIYYCLSKDRLTLSPDLATLRRLLNRSSEPKTAVPTAAKDGGQLVVEFNPRGEQSALRAVAGWLSEAAVRDAGIFNPHADLLLGAVSSANDDPSAYAQLSLSHLGGIPVTADGMHYRRAESGLLDPARGTAHAPTWPKVPVAGGVVEHILRILRRLRTEVSIDAEPGSPGVTSLRTRLLLER